MTPVSNVMVEPTHLRGGANDAARALWAEAEALRVTDPARSSALYERARDLDVVGIRASRRVQESVRTVAAETGARLVDTQRHLPREPGLDEPAASLFAEGDPLHLSAEGHSALALLVGDAIRVASGGGVDDVGAAGG